jgi:hypothetical protein
MASLDCFYVHVHIYTPFYATNINGYKKLKMSLFDQIPTKWKNQLFHFAKDGIGLSGKKVIFETEELDAGMDASQQMHTEPNEFAIFQIVCCAKGQSGPVRSLMRMAAQDMLKFVRTNITSVYNGTLCVAQSGVIHLPRGNSSTDKPEAVFLLSVNENNIFLVQVDIDGPTITALPDPYDDDDRDIEVDKLDLSFKFHCLERSPEGFHRLKSLFSRFFFVGEMMTDLEKNAPYMKESYTNRSERYMEVCSNHCYNETIRMYPPFQAVRWKLVVSPKGVMEFSSTEGILQEAVTSVPLRSDALFELLDSALGTLAPPLLVHYASKKDPWGPTNCSICNRQILSPNDF